MTVQIFKQYFYVSILHKAVFEEEKKVLLITAVFSVYFRFLLRQVQVFTENLSQECGNIYVRR